MPPSNKNINVRHGTNAHRVRARYQTARSNSPEKRPEIERRASRSEDIEMISGASAGKSSSVTILHKIIYATFDPNALLTANRFALLPHTEPAPGLGSEHAVRPPQSEFTFLHELHYPPAACTTPSSDTRVAFPSEGMNKVVPPHADASSTRNPNNSDHPSQTATPRTPAPRSQQSKHFQPPATPPQTPPLEPLPISIKPTIQTATSSPEYVNLLSPSATTRPMHPSLPTSSPMTTAPASRPHHHPPLKKPIVHLPPTKSTQQTPSPTLPQASTYTLPSDLQFQTQLTTAAETQILAMAAEIAAATYVENLKGKAGEPARKFGAKRMPISRVRSEGTRGVKAKELGVGGEEEEEEGDGWEDEGGDGGSDGEWEFVG